MKIISAGKVVLSKNFVEDGADRYCRTEYKDGKIIWTPTSYDGECDEEILEASYQTLISGKPATEKYMHMPTGLIYEFVEKKDRRMAVILKSISDGMEIWAGFIRADGVKDWKKME